MHTPSHFKFIPLTRDIQLLSIRPVIEPQADTALDEGMASFQLNTLRPILKFQNDFFAKLCAEKLLIRHSEWAIYKEQKRRELLSSWISLDVDTKKTIEGSIIALMTSSELDFYFLNEKEIQKRIRAFLIERLKSI